MKIVVCGGGTAGHITPVLAVIDALRRFDPTVEIVFIGSGSEVEQKLLRPFDVEYKTISAGKFRRYRRGWKRELTDIKTNQKNAADLVRFSKGYFQAKKIIKRFKPDVVFTKGGYVTVPVGLAASKLKIPLVIHDSDVVFGMASRMLSSKATVIATGFPVEAFASSPVQDKMVYTGNPVRTELLSSSLQKAKTTFGFQSKKPIIFILCGSQGAEAINQVIFDGLELITKHYNIIHHTGAQGIEQARVAAHRLPADLQNCYQPFEFLQDELTDALFLADAVVIRPSASVVAEIAAHSKPAILIPSPHSANNHLQKNAEFIERKGAARILNQSDLSAVRLCADLEKILASPKAKKYLQTNIHEFWVSDSAKRIAKLIEKAGSAHE